MRIYIPMPWTGTYYDICNDEIRRGRLHAFVVIKTRVISPCRGSYVRKLSVWFGVSPRFKPYPPR